MSGKAWQLILVNSTKKRLFDYYMPTCILWISTPFLAKQPLHAARDRGNHDAEDVRLRAGGQRNIVLAWRERLEAQVCNAQREFAEHK